MIDTNSRVQLPLSVSSSIAHIHGGEVTAGAFDDSIRHSITKLSHLHFPCHEKYKQRLIQLVKTQKVFLITGR